MTLDLGYWRTSGKKKKFNGKKKKNLVWQTWAAEVE